MAQIESPSRSLFTGLSTKKELGTKGMQKRHIGIQNKSVQDSQKYKHGNLERVQNKRFIYGYILVHSFVSQYEDYEFQ